MATLQKPKFKTIDKNSINKDCYIYIIRDMITKTMYKISISNESVKNKKQINNFNVIFEVKLDKTLKSHDVINTIHQYLKEKNYWLHSDWFKIDSEDEIVKLADSMLGVSDKNN